MTIILDNLLVIENELSGLNSIEQRRVSGGGSPAIASSSVSESSNTYTFTSVTSIDANGKRKTVGKGFGYSKGYEIVTSESVDISDPTKAIVQQISF